MDSGDTVLRQTALHSLHVELGARMVPFAGYHMPVQYPAGILNEHRHTRSAASLFDVSHMGQFTLTGADAAAALETLVTASLLELGEGRQRYALFTNDSGGILDDLMVANQGGETLFLVVNAARKDADYRHLSGNLDGRVELAEAQDHSLVALQGPKAEAALIRHVPDAADLAFMDAARFSWKGGPVHISRSGYTGEDGFEISLPDDAAADFVRVLLAEAEVEPAGLGARDALRLEAGMCLYGHDIDETTTPVEAALEWAVGKRRRKEGGFPGAGTIQEQLAKGAPRRRVGILPEGRAPAREGTAIFAPGGEEIGAVTSGGFGPTVGAPVAMGYVRTEFAEEGTGLELEVRGKRLAAKVAALPFVEPRYYRG